METVLEMGFTARGGAGSVSVAAGVVTDAADLGFPLLGLGSRTADAALGFPVIQASVNFDGRGYHRYFGWVQIVHQAGDGEQSHAEIDLPPVLAGTGAPFVVFGYQPTLFDAPANPHHPDGVWLAYSFLVAVPDLVISRTVEAVAGFKWGYQLADGRPSSLPVEATSRSAWRAHIPMLQDSFPDWSFRDPTCEEEKDRT